MKKWQALALDFWSRYKYWVFITGGIFLLGSLVGLFAPTLFSDSASEGLKKFVDNFMTVLPSLKIDSKLEASQAIATNIRLLVVFWLLGLSLVGLPFIGALLFFRGFALGLTISYLISRQVSSGLVVTILAVLPQNIVFLPVLLGAAILASVFSLRLIKKNNTGKSNSFAFYNACFGFLAAGAAFSAWVQGYVTPFLLNGFLNLL